MLEYVYARHDFIPEHDDEISFHAGERIEIVEKDELYGDGWWKVCSRSPLSISPIPFDSGFAYPFQLSASSFLSRGCSRANLTLLYYVLCPTHLFIHFEASWGVRLADTSMNSLPRDAFPLPPLIITSDFP
jgi:hypothetical protein